MKWIRERVLRGELLAGTFLNLGSSLTAEIAGRAGLDWIVIDLEHGAGDRQNLLFQLQALENGPTGAMLQVNHDLLNPGRRTLSREPDSKDTFKVLSPNLCIEDRAVLCGHREDGSERPTGYRSKTSDWECWKSPAGSLVARDVVVAVVFESRRPRREP